MCPPIFLKLHRVSKKKCLVPPNIESLMVSPPPISAVPDFPNLHVPQTTVTNELCKIHEWLCANRLSFDTDKTNFVLFHISQKRIADSFSLRLNDKEISRKQYIKYLGVLIDSHLNWKERIHNLSKKLSKSVGFLCKLRHHVSSQTLTQLYYALVYPFLGYSCILPVSCPAKENRPYPLSFAKFDAHTNPLFARLNILKLHDIIFLYSACYMYQFSKSSLPKAFDNFFTRTNTRQLSYTFLFKIRDLFMKVMKDCLKMF